MKPLLGEAIDLVFLMDRSGSMGGSETDTIGGFNAYLQREKKKDFETYVTTILFDDRYEVLYQRKPINEVSELTEKEYWVRGCTALFDAIGKTIHTLDSKTSNKVLFVIMTDGLENSSREYTKQQIINLINNHNWEFVFIGADIDSYSEAHGIGIDKSRTANYRKSRDSIDKVFNSIENLSYDMRMDRPASDEWKDELREYDD